jgi:MFS family permease
MPRRSPPGKDRRARGSPPVLDARSSAILLSRIVRLSGAVGTESVASRPRLTTFAALGEHNYRLFWLGLILYVIGHRAEFVTSYWLAWELTGDPLALGYLGLAQGLPVVVLQVLGGVLADRINRLRLLIGTQLLTNASLTVLFGLTATAALRFEHLLLLSALSATFRAFDEPARISLVPHLVQRDKLANAIALNSIPWQSGRIVGPSLAGLLIYYFGPPVGFGLAMVSSYGALGLYSRIRVKFEDAVRHGQSFFSQFTEGFAFVGRNFLFGSLIGLVFINSVFGMSYVTLLPIYADVHFDAGSSGFGLMQAAHGVGSVIGTLTIASFVHRLGRRGSLLLVGATCFGLLLIVFSRSPSIWFAMVILSLMGLSATSYMTLANTALQEKVPDALRGRVMGLYALCWNLIPIGGFLGGALARALDARFAVTLGGAVVASTALLLLVFSKRLRTVD